MDGMVAEARSPSQTNMYERTNSSRTEQPGPMRMPQAAGLPPCRVLPGTAPEEKTRQEAGSGKQAWTADQRWAAMLRAWAAALFSAAIGGVLPSKASLSSRFSTGSMRS